MTLEGLVELKIAMTPTEIQTATLRFKCKYTERRFRLRACAVIISSASYLRCLLVPRAGLVELHLQPELLCDVKHLWLLLPFLRLEDARALCTVVHA
jgi:hypothetical protein